MNVSISKGILTLLLMGLPQLYAAASNIEFSYAGNDASKMTYYGKSQAQRYDVGMSLTSPEFVGMKIKNIKAYYNQNSGAQNCSMWVTNTLSLKGKEMVADILETPVSPVAAKYCGQNYMMLEYSPEDLVIESVPLYMGYSMDIPQAINDAQKYPIAVYVNDNPDGFWLHAAVSVLRWTNYAQSTGRVPIIVVELEGDLPDNSLTVRSIDSFYAGKNSQFKATVSATNFGGNEIESIGYEYQTGNGALQNGYCTFETPIVSNPGSVVTFPVSLYCDSDPGTVKLAFTVTEVNGEPNASSENYAENDLDVYESAPTHRPLVEEYTGLWCPWCPKGYVSMEAAHEKYGDDAVLICYHSGDAMEPYEGVYYGVGGFPSLFFNRGGSIDPYYGTHSEVDMGLLVDIENDIKVVPKVEIDFNELSLEGNVISFTSSLIFKESKSNARYKLGYVVTENGISDPSYFQANNYAGASNYFGTGLEFFANSPSRVGGLTFNNVAVNIDGMNGVANSVPSNVVAEEEYTHDFQVNIANSKAIHNRDNLSVAIFLIDETNGKVLNAKKAKILGFAGIGSLETDMNVGVVRTDYYDLQGRKVANPQRGLYIVNQLMSDGTRKSFKQIFR